MNVIIKIEGREAIPVRAIPLLTDWKTVTPDILAAVLSGDEHFFCFTDMQAYRVFNGDAVTRRWWGNYVSEPLQALGDEIRATETTHKTGKEQWKCESLGKLPAGVYVWRDEFARAHQRHYGRTTLPLDVEDKDVQLSDAESAKLAAKHQERIALDYAPFLNDELRALVMEGFLPGAEPITMSERDTVIPAPVVAQRAAGGTVTVWTIERKEAARAMMNEQRGSGIKAFAANTAAAFGVTAARLRDVLKDKPKKSSAIKANGVWDV